jgi:bifunctional DNA-binding transcriptional regulator/antitoxin component of YhaV-PrlF toxin-antitoxin module
MAAKGAAKLSAKFQICIPKAIRTARRWQAGQVFACIPKGEGMLLVPVPQPEELFGLARSLRIVEYDGRRVPYASDAEMATARVARDNAAKQVVLPAMPSPPCASGWVGWRSKRHEFDRPLPQSLETGRGLANWAPVAMGQ